MLPFQHVMCVRKALTRYSHSFAFVTGMAFTQSAGCGLVKWPHAGSKMPAEPAIRQVLRKHFYVTRSGVPSG